MSFQAAAGGAPVLLPAAFAAQRGGLWGRGGDPVRASSHRKRACEPPTAADDRHATARMDRNQYLAASHRHVVGRGADTSRAAHTQVARRDAHDGAPIVVRHPQATESDGKVVRLGAGRYGTDPPPRPD